MEGDVQKEGGGGGRNWRKGVCDGMEGEERGRDGAERVKARVVGTEEGGLYIRGQCTFTNNIIMHEEVLMYYSHLYFYNFYFLNNF